MKKSFIVLVLLVTSVTSFASHNVAVLISFQGENFKMLAEQPRHYKYSVRCVR